MIGNDFSYDYDLIDWVTPYDKKRDDQIIFDHIKDNLEKAYFPTREEMIEITQKGHIYLGAEFECDDFIGHFTIPAKILTMHQIKYGTSGCGKTMSLIFFLCCLMIQKDIAEELEIKDVSNEMIKIYDALVIDNLGNFANLGEPYLQEEKPEFLAFYLRSGWTTEYLRKLGSKWVIKYRPHNDKLVSLYKNAHVVPNLDSATDFTSYLQFLGSDVMKIEWLITAILDEMDFFSQSFNKEMFSLELFYKYLETKRDMILYQVRNLPEADPASAKNIKELWQQITILNKLIDPLKVLQEKYPSIYDTPEYIQGKIVIQDCQGISDQWLFHSTIVNQYYKKFCLGKNLQGINMLFCSDEYNDIVDSCERANERAYAERRDGILANSVRSFFLRIIREARNFGVGAFLATQNPSQLLHKEGRKLSNINIVWVGYLGKEIARLEKNNSLESTIGHSEILIQESEDDGWISEKQTGRWIIIIENKVHYIQTFVPFIRTKEISKINRREVMKYEH